MDSVLDRGLRVSVTDTRTDKRILELVFTYTLQPRFLNFHILASLHCGHCRYGDDDDDIFKVVGLSAEDIYPPIESTAIAGNPNALFLFPNLNALPSFLFLFVFLFVFETALPPTSS